MSVCVCLSVCVSLCVDRKLSDKAGRGHQRNNSDGTIQLTMSSSWHDLSSLGNDTTTTTTTTGPATTTRGADTLSSPRRRSVMVTAAETHSLGSVEFSKPEVCWYYYY